MSIQQNSTWRTRLVRHGFPDRAFDIEFWREQGDESIFAAAWEMLELAEEIRGVKPRLQTLLCLLNELEVEYLIVGGFAVMKYGEPRYTKDLDVWVRNSAKNSVCVVEALAKCGIPLDHDGINAGTEKQVCCQIGVARARTDVLTEITGVEFSDAWSKRVASTFFGVPVHFISLDDLVTDKQAMGRSDDLKDMKRSQKSISSQNE
jgi:hypothetical protein